MYDDNVDEANIFDVPARVSENSHFSNMDEYKKWYDRSVTDPDGFWAEMARKELTWFKDFSATRKGSFKDGDLAWFLDGKLNVSYNCLDRHMKDKADQVAIIWEGDEPGVNRSITYREALNETCKIANLMKGLGLKKGDAVAIYMPMVPETLFVMLACTRLGCPHSVVFAGFSAEALRDRMVDSNCKLLFTADEGRRGGRGIPLKITSDKAVAQTPNILKTIVLKRTGAEVPFNKENDLWYHEAIEGMRPYCPCEWMDAEDILFFLYTSGSTGRPKGMVHTQAGYLLYTAMTHKYVFDYRPGDIFACVADVGWITGHSYILYGPLCNGATTVVFESTPMYPDAGRYWDVVERLKITQFYTAPTAIRVIMKDGDEPVKKYDLSSLRVLGTVGEPINPEAWRWYYNVVGDKKCSIVDTWWQTETGGHMLTGLAGCTPMKAGSASFPFFGVQPVVLDDHGKEIEGNGVKGILALKCDWPSIARTIHGDHQRYLKTYMKEYDGFYFSGDGCRRDKDGYYWITGRVDDVINVAGHRLGTAEIESALVLHESCSEAAVITIPHSWKGEAIIAYCTLKGGFEPSLDLIKALRQSVRTNIGAFASPDLIVCTPGLPKTRSGKIMRRVLRKVAQGDTKPEQLGDTSTLADPSVVDLLIKLVGEQKELQMKK